MSPVFWRAFTGAAIGKLLIALLLAGCVVVGFGGPDQWVRVIIGTVPTKISPGVGRLGLLLLASVGILLQWYPTVQRRAADWSGSERRMALIVFISLSCAPFIVGAFYVAAKYGNRLTPAEEYEGSPIGIAWGSARLVGHIPASGQLYIDAFIMNGRNISESPATISDAYVISARDSTKVPMRVGTPDLGAWLPSQIKPIPPHTELEFIGPFREYLTPKGEGDTESELIREWNPLTVVVEQNGKTLKREFGGAWLLEQIKHNYGETEFKPRVTPKK